MSACYNTLLKSGWLRDQQLFSEFLVEKSAMKTHVIVGISLAILVGAGCSDREAEARRAREEAEAKARAEAARKEMEAMPKAFKSRDYFKKNEPEKKVEPAPAEKKAEP
jgi:hypothetical protein